MSNTKRKFGDRRDGRLMRELDSMHYIVPLLYPNRCDNEAFISIRIDLTNMNAYLEGKNAGEPVYKYNMFQCIVTAAMKTLTLRPKMNRFIANKNVYQRDAVSSSFVVKKEFSDDGGEALAFVRATPDDTLDTVHEKIYSQISGLRSDKVDRSTDSMNILNAMPRFLSKALVAGICQLDKHGLCPDFLVGSDPYYSSIVLSNLGSIGLKMGYHHLTNWGTNSVFIAVGEKKMTPVCYVRPTRHTFSYMEGSERFTLSFLGGGQKKWKDRNGLPCRFWVVGKRIIQKRITTGCT